MLELPRISESKVKLFHVVGNVECFDSTGVLLSLAQKLRSLPDVIVYGARWVAAARANELHRHLTAPSFRQSHVPLFYAFQPTSATFHLKEQADIAQHITNTPGPGGKVVASKIPSPYPALAPAVGRTDWIIPTDLELETTKDKELSVRLASLVADHRCFMTGLPFARVPDVSHGTQLLRQLLESHGYNLARVHATHKIVVTVFTR
jgi:hypothetical protein